MHIFEKIDLIEISISWDESGTKLENELELLSYKLNLDGNWEKENPKLQKIIKRFGSHNKNIESINYTQFFSENIDKYNLMFFLRSVNLKDEFSFNDLEFLVININLTINGETKNYKYEKSMLEFQDSPILHICNICKIGILYETGFEEIYDYIKSSKVLKKELKIKEL